MATNAALADSLMVNDLTSRHISEGHIIVSNCKTTQSTRCCSTEIATFTNFQEGSFHAYEWLRRVPTNGTTLSLLRKRFTVPIHNGVGSYLRMVGTSQFRPYSTRKGESTLFLKKIFLPFTVSYTLNAVAKFVLAQQKLNKKYGKIQCIHSNALLVEW